jgi:SAM-dependent methyltransferase
MVTQPNVDFGKAAADYARHRQGFPPQLFDRLGALGIGLPGQRVLDLGTGTGLLARDFARRGCWVTGLDPSEAMIVEARRADQAAGPSVDYIVGRAEATGLPGAAYDVVSAGTCWHWFDRRVAAREARRLLQPAGRLVLAHLDWQFLPGNVVDATQAVIDKFAPPIVDQPGTFEYPSWLDELVAAGFDRHEAFGFATSLRYSHAAWRGRIRASARVAPAMDPAALAGFDAELARVLGERFPAEPLQVDHRVFAVIAWTAGRDSSESCA